MVNRMSEFLDEQRREALGPVNKWFCSQFHGYEVTDPECLIAYYIKHGGAKHFRQIHGDESSLPASTGHCQNG
jgi:hypothetical protein